jgi:CheY-like chemotaxis protein
MTHSHEPSKAAARRRTPAEPLLRTRVLVADEDAAQRCICASYCDLFDFETAVARGRGEALALIRDGAFDVVLADVGMAAHGFSAWSRQPVIGLAPLGRAHEAQRWLATGFADVLAKPITASRLFAAVRGVIAEEVDASRSWAPAGF